MQPQSGRRGRRLYAHRGWAKAINNDAAGATADFDLARSMATDPDEIGSIDATSEAG